MPEVVKPLERILHNELEAPEINFSDKTARTIYGLKWNNHVGFLGLLRHVLEGKSMEEGQEEEGWPIREVWKDYEDIAMHFNDLLMKLRTQALAGVAALSALVGIFGRTGSEAANWKMAALVLAFLVVFWIAIWLIDFLYYNRLLVGAVRALLDLRS